MNVLIIDDDPMMRFLVEYALRTTTDWHVRSVEHCGGTDAEKPGTPPDVIVVNVLMPGVRCRSVLAELERREMSRDVPVVFLTEEGDHDCQRLLAEAGAAGWITKPFHPATLAQRLANTLAVGPPIPS